MSKYDSLHVELLQHNAAAENIVATAAKLCYSSADISSLKEKVSSNDQKEFIENLASMGHLSVFEHIVFSFAVEGVSRTLTHQLVRHRIASYSQKSQRYVSSKTGFDFITPPSIKTDEKANEIFTDVMNEIAAAYAKLSDLGIPAEDARYLLPNACETKIIITMNARELIHFFSIRSCNRAQWEIRNLSDKMLELAYNAAPAIFEKAGPSCVRGKCSEGKFNCGKSTEVRQHISNITGYMRPKLTIDK